MGHFVSIVAIFLYFCISQSNCTYLTAAELASFSVSGNFQATIQIDSSSNTTIHRVTSSGMPDHNWQRVNPNTPTVQNHEIDILQTPVPQTNKGCLPMGKVGITRTGVAIYNPLAGGYVNAVEGNGAETFDSCGGHPSPDGSYHYHRIPHECLLDNTIDNLLGVAADGYPIYGPNLTGHAALLTTSDLDRCHGMTHYGRYIYVATYEFPYILGCFNGLVIDSEIRTTYACQSNSSYDSHWGYLCSCHETPGASRPRPPRPPPPGNASDKLQVAFTFTSMILFIYSLKNYLKICNIEHILLEISETCVSYGFKI